MSMEMTEFVTIRTNHDVVLKLEGEYIVQHLNGTWKPFVYIKIELKIEASTPNVGVLVGLKVSR